jgi:hypothetical protein
VRVLVLLSISTSTSTGTGTGTSTSTGTSTTVAPRRLENLQPSRTTFIKCSESRRSFKSENVRLNRKHLIICSMSRLDARIYAECNLSRTRAHTCTRTCLSRTSTHTSARTSARSYRTLVKTMKNLCDSARFETGRPSFEVKRRRIITKC